jgi:ribonuclease BN (tRNA processing enzyme)
MAIRAGGAKLSTPRFDQIYRRAAIRIEACASIGLLAATLWPLNLPARACTGHGVEVQVLGSGGPELKDGRASSGYLIWQDHVPRVLVDAGTGSALNFAKSGARVEQLDLVLLTHLHVDHSADLAGLIKSSYFESRDRPLPVYGPAAGGNFPSTVEFVADLFGPHGAYRYLALFTSGQEGGYLLQPHNVVAASREPKNLFRSGGVAASATAVVHGHVPALAWRVEAGGRSIVFSGDTNGDNGHLERLVQDADVFVAHNAVPEGSTGVIRQLHMPPSVIGRIARAGNVKMLVLSHRMVRTLGQEQTTLQAIAGQYLGPVAFADDLDCF